MLRFLFFITIILSLLSQLPMVLESGLDAYLKLSWIPLTFLIIIKYPEDLINRRLKFYYIFIIVFGWYIFIAQSITSNQYISSGGDFYNILISFLIFMDCFIFWKYNADTKNYKIIVRTIIIGCLILGTVVYFFFLQFADMSSTTYAYNAKNSLAQILFVGCVMALTSLATFHNKMERNLIITTIVILLIIIMLLKSRATIICIFFVLLYYMTKYGTKRQRRYLCFTSVIVTAFIFINQAAYRLVVVNIIFANRNASSASSLSSGRSELIMKALDI